MTCKDCIHRIVCAVYAPNFDDVLANGENCSEFKNESNLITTTNEKMTVKEYREKHPNCKYCKNRMSGEDYECSATGKRITKRTAKKCPCYIPIIWKYE